MPNLTKKVNLTKLVSDTNVSNITPEKLHELLHEFAHKVDGNALELDFLKKHYFPEYRKKKEKSQLQREVKKNTLKINHVLAKLLKNGNPFNL